jgi:hypothetical protein
LQAQLDGRPTKGPPDEVGLPLPTTWLFDPDTFAPASKIVESCSEHNNTYLQLGK